jgi:hypothetical protein
LAGSAASLVGARLFTEPKVEVFLVCLCLNLKVVG